MSAAELEGRQRAAVVAEALTWLNTPYHHHARIKGVGVDCAQLLIAVYGNAGVVGPIDPGQYSTQWHLHRNEEIYLGHLERHASRVQTPGLGDVGVFRFGRTFSHAGIFVGTDQLVHSYLGAGVHLSRLHEEPLCGREVWFFSVWGA